MVKAERNISHLTFVITSQCSNGVKKYIRIWG